MSENKTPKTLSRRDFLKNAGIVVGGTAVGSAFFLSACGEEVEVTKTVTTTASGATTTVPGATNTVTATQTQAVTNYLCPVCNREFNSLEALKTHFDTDHESTISIPKANHIEVDYTICSGCGTCESVCSLFNEGVTSPLLSRIQVSRDVLDGYLCEPLPCLQCDGPECMGACTTGALYVHPLTKARVIDPEKCTGCMECIDACPLTPKRIRFNAETHKAFKCNLCNGAPQCVKFCPMGALTFKGVA